VKIFLILGTLLALQSFLSLREGFLFFSRVEKSLKRRPGSYAPPAAVIIPCKGWSPEYDLNLGGFLGQDYPRLQLIFVVASRSDPACAALASRLDQAGAANPAGASKAKLVIAGFSDVRGEKVHNLIQGLAAVEGDPEILVFADIDARPRPDWLRSLVAPLEDQKVAVSTGFRWYLPGSSFTSQFQAAWDTSIATMLGDRNSNFAWGGSMAVRAADFRRLEVVDRHWARGLSDDYGLTRAVHAAGGKIRFEPRCLLATREDSTLGEFLRWSTRQIILTRVYALQLWLLGLASQGLYCGTFLLGFGMLASGRISHREDAAVGLFLAGILFLGMAKGSLRTVIAYKLFPEETGSLDRFGACYWQLAPLVPWVMVLNFVIAGFARRIEWRGTRYELRSPNDVKVIHRDNSLR
jgi:ceramide glucosyltransferase